MKPLLHLAAALLPALGLPAWADGPAPALPDAGAGILQVILGLALVLALFWGSLQIMKRLQSPRGGASSALKVVSATAVGPRERVVVVEIGDTWLVVGVAPGQVTALATLPRQETPPDAPAPDFRDFGSRLKQFIERRKHES